MSGTISEIIQQPRTGSMCPIYSSKDGMSGLSECGQTGNGQEQGICQDSNQFSWNSGTADKVTLGHCTSQDDSNKCPAGQWAWQYGNSTDWQCIAPVKQLCALPTWDGLDYDVANWDDQYWKDNPNPLWATVSDASFYPDACVDQKESGTGGGEATTRTATCDLKCEYDLTKFTDLDQVLAWEQRYGKYTQDTGSGSGTTRNERFESTGDIVTLQDNPAKPFTDNYEAIMQNFCSQKSTTCPIDPVTIAEGNPQPAPYCSYLKSLTKEGDACRYWMNSYGPYKWKQMDAIGNKYCAKNPDSFDCRCVNRAKAPGYNKVESIIPTGVSDGCWFLPCADPTNYIVGSDVMDIGGAEGRENYGLNCGNEICANIISLNDNDFNEVNNNSLIIQCGTSGRGFSGPEEYLTNLYITDPIAFGLLITAIVCGAFFVIFFLVYLYQVFSQKYYQNNASLSSISRTTPNPPIN